MNTNHVAALGFGMMMGERVRIGATETGLTSPATILNRLQEVDTAVQTTNAAITLKPPPGPQGADFLVRWKAWYADWNQFAANERSLANLLSPLLWAARSDESAREIEARARQHDQLRAEYTQLGGHVIGPDVPPIPPPSTSGWSLPWWVWTLGGVAVVGVGYYLYRTYIGRPLQIARSFSHDIEAPPRGGDRPIRYVQSGSPEPSYPAGIPLSVQDVAHHPMPAVQHVVYRPYQHPHVVHGSGDRELPPFRSSLDGYKDPTSYESDYDDWGDE